MAEEGEGNGRGRRRTGAIPHMTCLHDIPGRFRGQLGGRPCSGSGGKAPGGLATVSSFITHKILGRKQDGHVGWGVISCWEGRLCQPKEQTAGQPP